MWRTSNTHGWTSLLQRDTSAPALCRGDLNPLTAKTLAAEGHWKRRKVREAIEVKLTPQATINLDEGGVRLSPIWDILLT